MILVVNAGSTSVKVALFRDDLSEILRAAVSGIGGEGRLTVGAQGQGAHAQDPEGALSLLLRALEERGFPASSLSAAAHRVVHGGEGLVAPARLDPATLSAIEAAAALAPLHNPANLAGIRALERLAPRLPQYASFDTAFHATLPPEEAAYPLPAALRARGFRRFGFHGLSYAALTDRLREEGRLPRRLLAFHLGGGASACAILDGRSVATTMGWSPLEGLPMGTRTGAIDPMAVLALARERGIADTETLLNREGGLLALAGTSDMAAILRRAERGEETARFALDHFTHWAARHGAGLLAALGGADALAFTGGIGENAPPVREAIAARLAFLGPLPVHVVPAAEERRIAAEARSLMGP
ncbi:acetate/propionate family kinase [Rubellimicrobium sp. CFH 75288]|uniref:acetate/propionate family kinase n=1 Tax=Rubellimicrobium sp. CFH 75288 TaxID=2697034 RepID=UPI001412402C|nr:acetate kinase [Rubellimicrobium sp. CFH 75288]NAZ38008.1 acetate kinase [Rubellimicrobium sp. CFH 75288]